MTIFLLFIDFVPFFLIARLKFSTALPRSRWRQITLRPLCTVAAATQYAPFSPVSKRPNFCGQYLAFFALWLHPRAWGPRPVMGQAALGMPLLILLLLGILTVPNNSQAKGKNSLLFVQFCFNNFSAQPL